MISTGDAYRAGIRDDPSRDDEWRAGDRRRLLALARGRLDAVGLSDRVLPGAERPETVGQGPARAGGQR